MAKKFLTSLDLNKNQLLNAVIHSLSSAPSSPVAGQIYYNTGDATLRYYSGSTSSWITLAQGGDLTTAINNAIDALDTDDIEEGANNLYFTDQRALDATASAYDAAGAASAAQAAAENYADGLASNYDPAGSAAAAGSASNAYADSLASNYDPAGSADTAYNNAVSYVDTEISGLTTFDIGEDPSNLYYTDARARTAISSGNNTITYNSSTGEITANTSTMATVSYVDGEIVDLTTYVDQEISDSANTVTAAYIAADSTLSNTLTTAYQGADSALEASLTQDFQDADNTVIDTLRGEIAAASQGLDIKNSVRAATTANITLTGAQTIDGVSIVAGDRVLVKNQTNAALNGIYVAAEGSGAAGEWLRADDAGDGELTPGSFTFVEEGTVNGDSGWVVSTNGTIVVGEDDIVWTQFSGTGQIVAGNGIVKTGSTLSVDAGDGITVDGSGVSISNTYAGQTSIDTVGTITTGTWEGSVIETAYGGTGADLSGATQGDYVTVGAGGVLTTSNTVDGADVDGDISGNAENVNGTVAIANGGTGATTAAGARANLSATTKYAENNTTLNPVSNTITWTVTHNINTTDVTVQMRDLGDGALVEADVVVTNANTVTISWYSASTISADAYRVVVVG